VRLWVNGQLLINRWSDRTIQGDSPMADGAVDTEDFNAIASNWKGRHRSSGDVNTTAVDTRILSCLRPTSRNGDTQEDSGTPLFQGD